MKESFKGVYVPSLRSPLNRFASLRSTAAAPFAAPVVSPLKSLSWRFALQQRLHSLLGVVSAHLRQSPRGGGFTLTSRCFPQKSTPVVGIRRVRHKALPAQPMSGALIIAHNLGHYVTHAKHNEALCSIEHQRHC